MKVTLQAADLYDWQTEVFRSYVHDDFKTYVLNTSRQIGKSFLASQLILYSAMNNNNVAVGVTSLTYKQTKLIYENISNVLKKTPILKSDNKSELKIELINGSTITFLSIQNSDNIRGFTFDYLFADEAAYYPPGVWDKVLVPTTLAKGKKVVLFSTPRGTNFFYDLFMDGINPDVENVISFKFDYRANPNFNANEIAAIKRQLPDAVFRAEFLAEFTDNGTVFNNVRNACIHPTWPSPQGNLVAGIDVGLFADYAVCCILDSAGNLVAMYRNKTGSINTLNTELEAFLNEHKPKKTLVELNNVGVSLYEYLYPRVRGIEGFKTTAVSKGPLINQLQNSLEDNRIKLPDQKLAPEIYNELINYSFSYSEKTRTIQYAALAGHHDDICVALALANKLFVEMNYSIKPKVKVFYG
jgi:hypothetical protein